MEDNNKRLEQFFQQSMDRFNESPDDLVWDNIADRLDDDAPWYLLLWRNYKHWLPLLLALMLLGTYWMFQKDNSNGFNIEQQNKYMSQLTVKNDQLEEKLKTFTSEIDQYKNQLATLKSQLHEQAQTGENENVKNKYSKKAPSTDDKIYTLIRANKTLKQELANMQSKMENLQSALNICTTNYHSLVKAKDTQTIEQEVQKVNSAGLSLIPYFPWKKTLNKDFKLPEKDAHQSMVFTPKSSITKKGAKPKRYRLGPSARLFNTYVQNSAQVNPGRSWGLKQEYKLNHRFSLSHMLHYNEQEYTISNANNNPLSADVLERIPGGIERENTSVSQVDARSKYLDTNLGIKWNLTPNKKDFNWYINPSIVWQLYLPQEFQFSIAQADDIIVTENRYLGSLGSANIELGTEKRLANNLRLVVNAYYEQSFIPVGFDYQYLSIAGIGTKLMFGQ